ncbi:MAG: deoxynucleoside kinase [Gammaproteobacteria bacterium]
MCRSTVGTCRGEPFLPRFYQNPEEAALPTQLYSLFQRVRQAQTVRQRDLFATICVADFLLEKDRIFAELTLNPDELELYYRLYELLAPRAPTPDQSFICRHPCKPLLGRIEHRVLNTSGYLKQLAGCLC